MPIWTIQNTETGEARDEFFSSFSAREAFLEENKNYIHIPGSPRLVSGTGSLVSRIPDGFNDLLKHQKKFYGPQSTINTK